MMSVRCNPHSTHKTFDHPLRIITLPVHDRTKDTKRHPNTNQQGCASIPVQWYGGWGQLPYGCTTAIRIRICDSLREEEWLEVHHPLRERRHPCVEGCMKETIEWFSVFKDSERPREEERLLVKLNGAIPQLQGVQTGTYFWDVGFILDGGDSIAPTHWAYFPKGPK